MFCSKCGQENSAGAQFCSKCGASLVTAPKQDGADIRRIVRGDWTTGERNLVSTLVGGVLASLVLASAIYLILFQQYEALPQTPTSLNIGGTYFSTTGIFIVLLLLVTIIVFGFIGIVRYLASKR